MLAAAGSSPLARGLPALIDSDEVVTRIIPARAGFTTRRGSAWTWEICTTSRGSSPLARGLPTPSPPSTSDWGIIPARAGFTPAPAPAEAGAWDHPRSRGVYRVQGGPGSARPGSSPLARGLPDESVLRGRALGIIPARAGFTSPSTWPTPTGGDHPRSRGVYPAQRARQPAGRGIIPARAGFTGGPWAGPSEGADHPRSRGVYLCDGAILPKAAGSSPLARGLPLHVREHGQIGGIIPARAGFTCGPGVHRRAGADHPRSRGVYETGHSCSIP